MSDLKPCPFCGGMVKIEENHSYLNGKFYCVEHNRFCKVNIICVGDTAEEVAAKWNRRADDGQS